MNGITRLESGVFNNCTNLQSITIPAGVTSIGSSAFAYCDALTAIVISDGVTEIGDRAFNGCTSLKKISIPESVETIGEKAFQDTPWLTLKQEGSTLVIINNKLVDGANCSGNIIIPNGVTSIESSCLCGLHRADRYHHPGRRDQYRQFCLFRL